MSQILRLHMIGKDLLSQRYSLGGQNAQPILRENTQVDPVFEITRTQIISISTLSVPHSIFRQQPLVHSDPMELAEDAIIPITTDMIDEVVTSHDSPRAINRASLNHQASLSVAAKMGHPLHQEPAAIKVKVNPNDVLTFDNGENYSQIHMEHDSSRIILPSDRKEARIFIPNGSEATLILEDGRSECVKRLNQRGNWVTIRPGNKLKIMKFPGNSFDESIERTFSISTSSDAEVTPTQPPTPSLKMAAKQGYSVHGEPSHEVTRRGIPLKETKHSAGVLKDSDGKQIPLGFSGGIRPDGVRVRGNGKPIYTTLSVKPDEPVFNILVRENSEPGTYSLFILSNNFALVSNNKMSVRIVGNNDDQFVRSRQWTPIERGDKINIKIIGNDGVITEKNFTLENYPA